MPFKTPACKCPPETYTEPLVLHTCALRVELETSGAVIYLDGAKDQGSSSGSAKERWLDIVGKGYIESYTQSVCAHPPDRI